MSQFRSGTPDDAPAISALVLGVCEEFIFDDLPEQGRATLQDLYAADSLRAQMDAGAQFVLCEDGGDLVAAAAARDGPHCYLFYVDPDRHRGGLGRALWAELLEVLRAADGSVPRITLNSSAYAVGFYDRLGLVQTGPPFEKNGVTSVPMAWEPAIDKRSIRG